MLPFTRPGHWKFAIEAEVDLYQRHGFLLNRKITSEEVDALLGSIGSLPTEDQAEVKQRVKVKIFDSEGEVRRGYKFENHASSFKLAEALRS